MLMLTDANVFVPMVKGLRALGHDVLDIKEEGLEGMADTEIFRLAQNRRRVIVTMDKDFSNILMYPPGEHHGIIVLKLYRLRVAKATKLFLNTMKRLNPQDISRNLVIMDPRKTRIRKEKLGD